MAIPFFFIYCAIHYVSISVTVLATPLFVAVIIIWYVGEPPLVLDGTVIISPKDNVVALPPASDTLAVLAVIALV